MKWLIVFGTITCVCLLLATPVVAGDPETTGAAMAAEEDLYGNELRVLRLITMYELGRIHTKSLELDSRFAPMWDDLHDQLQHEAHIGANWSTKIVFSGNREADSQRSRIGKSETPPRDIGRAALADFETRALHKIAEGADEVVEHRAVGEFLYMRPIRVLDRCALCHSDAERDSGLPLPARAVPNTVDGAHISVQLIVDKKLEALESKETPVQTGSQ